MDMDSVKRQKQQYLREEIIDKGYSAQVFVEYLATVREDGDDIDMWEYDDLKAMVKQFQINQSISTKPVESREETTTLGAEPSQESKVMSEGQLAALEQRKREEEMGDEHIVIDSDEEEESFKIQPPIVRYGSPGGDREGSQLDEDFFSKSIADAKDAEGQVYLSENEKYKKDLLTKALLDKKATIVRRFANHRIMTLQQNALRLHRTSSPCKRTYEWL